MSCIDKLAIRGIRSFDPNQVSCIEFFKPLTIIAGVNGAGKTSVIESLRFATTGALPPNSSAGQSFVQDPRITNEAETVAVVKLKFRSSDEKPVMVTRAMKLTQKKNKQEFKRTENLLSTFDERGKKVSISNRCADIDRHIPQLMGVPKAILENVIFCHQEESNWPLEDARTLKQKFDDIFASSKYTKALDAIAAEKKRLQAELKELQKEVVYLNQQCQAAKVIKNNILQCDMKLGDYDDNIKRNKDEMNEKQKVLSDWNSCSSTTLQLIESRKQLEIKKESYAAQIQSSIEMNESLNLNHITQSVEELNKELEVISSEEKQYDSHVEAAEALLIRAQNKVKIAQQSYDTVCNELAQVKAESDAFKRTIIDRDDEIIKVASIYDIEGFSTSPIPHETLGIFINKIKSVKKNIETDLWKLQEQHRSDDESKSQEILKSESELTRLTHQERMYRTQVQSNTDRREQLSIDLRNVINNIQLLPDTLDRVDASAIEALHALNTFKEKYHLDDVAGKIEVSTKNLSNIRRRITELEMDTDRFREEGTAITIQKRNLELKSEDRNNKLNEIRGALSAALGDNMLTDPSIIHRAVTSKVEEIKSTVAVAMRDFEGKGKELSAITSLFDTLKHDVSNLEVTVNQYETHIQTTLGIHNASENFDKVLREFENKLNEAKNIVNEKRQSVKDTEAYELCYNSILQSIRDKKVCRICKHPVDDVAAVERGCDDDLALMKRKAEKSKDRLEHSVKELEGIQQKYDTCNMLNKEYYIKLHDLVANELPEKKKKLGEYSQRKSQLQTLLQDSESKLTRLKTEENDIVELSSKVHLIDKLHIECERLKSSISTAIDSNSNVALSANFEVELADAKKKRDAIELSLDSLRNEKEEGDKELRNLEYKYSQKLSTKQTAATYVTERKRIQDEVNKIDEESTLLNNQLKETKDRYAPLKDEIDKLKSARTDTATDYRSKEQELNNKLNIISVHLANIDKLINTTSLNGRLAPDENIKLKEMERTTSENDRQRSLKELEIANDKVRNVNDSKSTFDNIKKNVNAKLKVIELKKKISEIDTNVVKLKEFINSSKEKQKDFVNTYGSIDQLEGVINQLRERMSRSQGMKSEVLNSRASLSDQLLQPAFVDIETRLRTKRIEETTTKMAMSDLDTYWSALDKSVMKYHGDMMVEINKSIQTLWSATYKGNDIDFIQIKHDEEMEGGRARRNYNYRLIMVKSGVEVDMRGRCSAGQKVLASLIIRLALAETFGIHCGILALDEPTTNLDRANIESFAIALSSIIEERSKQKNFQLIVISHDYEFCSMLAHGQTFADQFYEVVRSSGTKQSTILKRALKSIDRVVT